MNPRAGAAEPGSLENQAAAERLAAVGALLADSFRFMSPDAPGLFFMGGLADPVLAGFGDGRPKISVAGSGLSEQDAEVRCLGEAAERLSCLYDPACAAEIVPAAEIPADLLAAMEAEVDALPCLQGQRLNDGEAVWVPAALVLHDPARRLPGPRGSVAKGMAAGPDWQAAVESALFELVERDAAALWWLGGRMPSPVPLEWAAGSAAAVLAALRQGQRGRRSWLLDISTEFGVPAVAAVSVMENGEGFACGLAAARDMGTAVRSALVEMAQMELSQHLIRGKARALGPEGLTEADFRQIERSVRITPESCPLILPAAPPRAVPENGSNPVAALTAARTLYAVDCTLPALDIPAAALLSPALQPMDAAVQTARLQDTLKNCGGGRQFHHGVQLI